MLIKTTYFVYKDVEDDSFPNKRVEEFASTTGQFETDAECFGYLCQKAWEERNANEDVEKIEVIYY